MILPAKFASKFISASTDRSDGAWSFPRSESNAAVVEAADGIGSDMPTNSMFVVEIFFGCNRGGDFLGMLYQIVA
jgi:hypothetical protein